MDRRRLSYATVAGGSAGTINQPSGSAFSHLVNPTTASPIRNSFYPAATAERHSPYLREDEKSTNTFWGKTSSTQTQYNDHDMARHSSRMPIQPSYLAGSRYLERLTIQHKARLAKEAEGKTPSMSRSASGTSLHRMAPSHRGMTYEIVEHIPKESQDRSTPPLPSRWAEKDKYGVLDFIHGTEIKYHAQSRTHDLDAASARTDYPMPRQCGIYYYEVTILSKSKDGMVAVGFSTPKAGLEKLPGWEPESWAYHSDDGKMFGTQAAGKQYGPAFSVNDVVGCGINFRTGKAFFTKNGLTLGDAFNDLKSIIRHKALYPSVGMKKPGAHVKVNFGREPFHFDIDQVVRDERRTVRDQIQASSIDKLHLQLGGRGLVAELVSQYLRHEGFIQTANSFQTEVVQEETSLKQDFVPWSTKQPEQDLHAITRQQIRSAILVGDIEKALILMDMHYPQVMQENPKILFRLKCRKFIEMISLASSQGTNHIDPSDQKAKARAYLDTQLGNRIDDTTDTTDRISAALTYARELQEEYKTDDSEEVTKALSEIFALFAYEDPRTSPLAVLMHAAGRLPVAEALNSAILVSLGAPSTTALERIYNQTQYLLTDNIEYGGSGAFINLDANIDPTLDGFRQGQEEYGDNPLIS